MANHILVLGADISSNDCGLVLARYNLAENGIDAEGSPCVVACRIIDARDAEKVPRLSGDPLRARRHRICYIRREAASWIGDRSPVPEIFAYEEPGLHGARDSPVAILQATGAIISLSSLSLFSHVFAVNALNVKDAQGTGELNRKRNKPTATQTADQVARAKRHQLKLLGIDWANRYMIWDTPLNETQDALADAAGVAEFAFRLWKEKQKANAKKDADRAAAKAHRQAQASLAKAQTAKTWVPKGTKT